jgi:hypothetical protein
MWATRQHCPSAASCPQPCRRGSRWHLHAIPPSACGGRAPCAAGGCCTSGLENAHGTEFREVLYRWHPWFGLRVAVHETVSRLDGIVFRCTLTGEGGRQLELPAWMFDQAACRDCFPLATSPLVSTMGLRALSDLLRNVLKRGATASTASPCGASCASRNEDVGEARARQHDETPNEGIERPAQRAATVRPVRREPAAVGRGHADMVYPSGRGKKRADRPDETTDPGARGSRAAERDRGGQP